MSKSVRNSVKILTKQATIFKHRFLGPLQESAVWVDESRTVPALQREAGTTAALVDDDVLALPEVKELT